MSTEIITCMIVQIVVLVGYLLTFITQKRKDRLELQAKADEQKDLQITQLNKMKNDIQDTLDAHRNEYLEKVEDLKDSISDIKGAYQESTATFTTQIDELSRRVEKHNNVIERTYKLEGEVKVIKATNTIYKLLEKEMESNAN